ncbi:M23 family metallopeptidase [Tomitella biformata]|uniref:M23 family metallopeptidase n=1 Tax=Tomitella biformata TaxID=630403 RepID=UPI000466B8F0|nr:M23 family metallopeptidase [Tomitella biformata]
MIGMRALYRHRMAVYVGAFFALVLGIVLQRVDDGLRTVALTLNFSGLLTLFGCLLVAVPMAKRIPAREPILVTSPVTGRWLALNSPATKVPSHGIRLYGQAHAIDLAYEPEGAARPQFGDGPAMRPAADYPAFGQPVRAMVAGTVVRVDDRQRDHRARSSLAAVLYMYAEGAIKEFGGPRRVVGNHIVIDAGAGVFALVAHLQQGSAVVEVGDTVAAGQIIGHCGNSGNSSEPHVHAQLMDRASTWTGQGLPLVFADVQIGEGPEFSHGVPENGEHMSSV